MKLTTGILVLAMTTGAGWAQNPDLIQNTKSTMNALQQKSANDSNAALAAAGVPAGAAKSQSPVPATPAQGQPMASKPAVKSQAAKTARTPFSPAVAHKSAAAKPAPKAAAKTVAVIIPKTAKPKAAKAKAVVAADTSASADAKPSDQDQDKDKKFSTVGKRDPFLSPVVAHNAGSGCSTGKKCLDIGQINLKGVVKADVGMIAVVTNSLNKAYFLRENDPVFNGYVVKITGDSITFKETFQDRLGKSSTREIVKKITTPAV